MCLRISSRFLAGIPRCWANYLAKDKVDLTGDVGGVTADVDVGLLLQQVADKLGVLLQTVLNVYLLGSLSEKAVIILGSHPSDLEKT